MLAERRTIDEKVGSELADGYCGSAVHALGAVAITERAADAFYRLRIANDAKSYPEALKTVVLIARSINAKRNYRIRPVEPHCEEILRYWMVPVCPACFGRKADVIEGTPHLGIACEACHGTGTRDYPWSKTAHDRFCREILYAIQEIESRTRIKLLNKLGKQIRDSGVLNT